MDGNIEEDVTDTLQRIVALLFSLAHSAQRASSRSYPVRCFVLWVLRRAEPYAWQCITRECGFESGAPLPRSLRTPLLLVILNTPGDARRIAATYRALARALEKQLRRNARLARRQAHWQAPSLEDLLSQARTVIAENPPALARLDRLGHLRTFLFGNAANRRWLNAGFP